MGKNTVLLFFMSDKIKKLKVHCDAKPFALGPHLGLDPQPHNFALGIPTCWYLKTLKFGLPRMPNLKFALPPTGSPNASQWNIGCLGSSGIGARIGHVHFRLFVSILFAFGSQRKRGFSVEYGLKNKGYFLPGGTLGMPGISHDSHPSLVGIVPLSTRAALTCPVRVRAAP